MIKKIKNQRKYKFIGILLYLIFSLSGFSILFIFPPKKLLFENTEIDEIKKNLFKNFLKIVYDNINSGFIKNITFTQENEDCPEEFDILTTENQYYGNFSKFYGNSSFCIQRSNITYENLLLESKEVCSPGKNFCGKLNRELNLSLCLDGSCPLTKFSFDSSSSRGIKYQLSGSGYYFIPYFGETDDENKRPPIIDIEIINNERLCLEKFYIENQDDNCEFFDNNQCFIHVGYDETKNLDLPKNLKLDSSNLAKWNLRNDKEINHDFCSKSSNFEFHIFSMNYFNFTYRKLQEFKTEFPFTDKNNNSLYNIYEAHKSHYNIDIFFHLISGILLCCSFSHFVLLIILYCNKGEIRIYYIINSIFLFFIKLVSFFCMITYHFWFYLKIKKVYIILLDKPLNELIKVYISTRKSFIYKLIIMWLVGLIIIIIDLVVFTFTITVQWGKFKFNLLKNKNENYNEINNKFDINIKNDTGSLNAGKINKKITLEEEKHENFENEENEENKKKEESNNNLTKSLESDSNLKENIEGINIELEFIFKNDLSKSYKLVVKKTELFKDVIVLLRQKYPELKEKTMKVFQFDSKIINNKNTIQQNEINDKEKIIIIP